MPEKETYSTNNFTDEKTNNQKKKNLKKAQTYRAGRYEILIKCTEVT